MPRIEVTHAVCSTTVTTDVSDDYDLDEGVALVCPTCQDVWWYYPLAVSAEGDSGVDAFASTGSLRPSRESRGRRRPVLATNSLAPALVLCAIAIVLLRLADLGPRATTPPAGAAAQRADSGTSGATGAASVAPVPYTKVIAEDWRIERPSAWVRFGRNGAQVLSPSRQSKLSVSIFVEERPSLTVDQLAQTNIQLLETQLPNATITGPDRILLRGADGQQVVARRDGFLREMIVVVAGKKRYDLLVSARPGTPRSELAQLSRITESFQATP